MRGTPVIFSSFSSNLPYCLPQRGSNTKLSPSYPSVLSSLSGESLQVAPAARRIRPRNFSAAEPRRVRQQVEFATGKLTGDGSRLPGTVGKRIGGFAAVRRVGRFSALDGRESDCPKLPVHRGKGGGTLFCSRPPYPSVLSSLSVESLQVAPAARRIRPRNFSAAEPRRVRQQVEFATGKLTGDGSRLPGTLAKRIGGFGAVRRVGRFPALDGRESNCPKPVFFPKAARGNFLALLSVRTFSFFLREFAGSANGASNPPLDLSCRRAPHGSVLRFLSYV